MEKFCFSRFFVGRVQDAAALHRRRLLLPEQGPVYYDLRDIVTWILQIVEVLSVTRSVGLSGASFRWGSTYQGREFTGWHSRIETWIGWLLWVFHSPTLFGARAGGRQAPSKMDMRRRDTISSNLAKHCQQNGVREMMNNTVVRCLVIRVYNRCLQHRLIAISLPHRKSQC